MTENLQDFQRLRALEMVPFNKQKVWASLTREIDMVAIFTYLKDCYTAKNLI